LQQNSSIVFLHICQLLAVTGGNCWENYCYDQFSGSLLTRGYELTNYQLLVD